MAGHTQMLAKTNAHKFVGDTIVAMLIMTLTPSRMASLDGSDSPRDLQARVEGSKLVAMDGASHEIHN